MTLNEGLVLIHNNTPFSEFNLGQTILNLKILVLFSLGKIPKKAQTNFETQTITL